VVVRIARSRNLSGGSGANGLPQEQLAPRSFRYLHNGVQVFQA